MLNNPELHLAALAASWLIYFTIHSVAASLRVKRWFAARHPGWVPTYRLLFNAQSILLLPFPLYLLFSWSGPMLWEWHGITQTTMFLLMALSVTLFVYTLKEYDSAEFFGFRQRQNRIQTVEDQEQFVLSTLHRFVRHPWYTLFLVIIWTQEMDAARLLSSILITLYLIIGSRMEEQKLSQYHPDIYPRYQTQVPGLLPNPFKFLSHEEARQLQQLK